MFETLEPKPADAILKLIGEHQNDPREEKVDLGVGVYRDADGNTPILNCVKKAEHWLVGTQTSKAYLGSRGDTVFCDDIEKLKAKCRRGGKVKGNVVLTSVRHHGQTVTISINEDVRLDAEMARRNSPIYFPPKRALPLVIAVGGAEPEGWIGLSRAYAGVCDTAGIEYRYMEIPGLDHVGIGSSVGDPTSPLARAMIEQIGLG